MRSIRLALLLSLTGLLAAADGLGARPDRRSVHLLCQSIIGLYRLVHDYLQVSKGLDNIIWAYHTTQNDGALERCYPGDDYVDVLGKSAYGCGLVFSEYDWAVAKKRQGKVIWWAELAGLVFWSDDVFYNVVGKLSAREVMAHPKIETLDK